MGGILKNAIPDDQSPTSEPESISQFRKQVLKNTELNAKLTSNSKLAHHNHGIPRDVLSMKLDEQDPETLKWNKKNLEENEITKQEFGDIHIDEPKTPYQGAVDPTGEYYRVDDDEDDLGGFTLGAPEVDLKDEKEPVTLLNNENADNDGDQDEECGEEKTEEDDAAAKHRRFEEMRKKHYNIKEALKDRKNLPDDEDEDEE